MIWIVTDKQDVAEAITKVCNDQGYRTTVIQCADDIAKRMRFRQPKVGIIDCSHAEIFDILRNVRAEPFAQRVPLVIFAMQAETFEYQSMLKGADAFVQKGPLDLPLLMQEVVKFAGPPYTSRG